MKPHLLKCILAAASCSILVAIVGVSIFICYKSATHTSTENLEIPVPQFCAPNCYSEYACDKVILVARLATAIEEAIGSESRLQLKIVPTVLLTDQNKNNRSSSQEMDQPVVCPGNKWLTHSRQISEDIKSAEPKVEDTTCKLQVPEEKVICADFMKLMECAVFRVRLAYSSIDNLCLTENDHKAWTKATVSVQKLAGLMDHYYDSKPAQQKSNWEEVKRNLTTLVSGLDALAYEWVPKTRILLPEYDPTEDLEGFSEEDSEVP